MNTEEIDVLLVEDNLDYASVLRMILDREKSIHFNITHAKQLSQALDELVRHPFDVILLDLSLPDSDGIDTFQQVYTVATQIPIVVLTALDDEGLATQAVRDGAQDYLIKGNIQGTALVRSLQYAIERYRSVAKLQHLSLIDELTGLFNRRGFISIARQHLKIAHRANRRLLLFFIDLDKLKSINDRFGHLQGDQALKDTAAILQSTFRSSDVLGRIGGDEFTVLAVDADDSPKSMVERLRAILNQYNQRSTSYQLSLSVGYAQYDPCSEQTLEDLLAMADHFLYLQKQKAS